MSKHKKPDHVFFNNSPEIFYQILSHFNVHDLAAMSQVSRWAHAIVANLDVDYLARMIKKVRRKGQYSKKIAVSRPFTCTYAQICEKLNLQMQKEKEIWATTYGAL